MRDVLWTALCDLLGIEYPVIQSGMGSVAGPDLVAEVSRTGSVRSSDSRPDPSGRAPSPTSSRRRWR